MARRNLVLGRGDRRGAFRVALLLAAVGFAPGRSARTTWPTGTRRSASCCAERADVVLEAAFVWLMYLAVEPYARRLRPWTLVSWTRFLGGGFSDPVVGRDTLAGVAWAVLVFYLNALRYVLPPVFGPAPPEPAYSNLDALLGAGPARLGGAHAASECILFALGALLLFVLLRTLLRRDAIAIVALARC